MLLLNGCLVSLRGPYSARDKLLPRPAMALIRALPLGIIMFAPLPRGDKLTGRLPAPELTFRDLNTAD